MMTTKDSLFVRTTLFLASLIAVSASIIPNVEILQGPSSKTVLIGPDGAAIDSAAPGGVVVTNDHGTGLVAAAPAALPLNAPLVVAGPAGSVATTYNLGGPAVVPGVAAPGLVAAPGPVAVVNESQEGAYVPDNIESLYDDGSYRGEH